MDYAPLLGPYQPDDVLAWDRGHGLTCRRFLAEVAALAPRLPDRSTVINLARDRYRFLVGLSAALLRGQTTLLPPSRTPGILEQLAEGFRDSYCLTDGSESVPGLPVCILSADPPEIGSSVTVPRIPTKQIAVVAFTSGSTGRPRPNEKTWGSLVTIAHRTGNRLGLTAGDKAVVVATVPHQHMFGLETSIMLPTQWGFAFHVARPLYPNDVHEALAQVPPRRILVTTPLHLKTCVTERTRLPELAFILSATAPLSRALAQQVEDRLATAVYEVYGFAEAGTVATRRTVSGDTWEVLDGLSISGQPGDGCVLNAPYLPAPLSCPDQIELKNAHAFVLQGRGADMINVAGHRGSLSDLNRTLTEIDGVEDGIFFQPEETNDSVTRVMAFVVAPGKTSEQILDALRVRVDPVFLPRPLHLVEKLPRNETGKLTRDSLLALAGQLHREASRGR